MALVNGIDTTSITNCIGVGISDISKMNGVTFSTPLTNQSIFRPGKTVNTSAVDRIIMPTTQEPTTDLRLTETDSFTINFWVKAGWTSALNSQGTYIAFFGLGSNDTTPGRSDSAYNNVFRVFYHEHFNRLYFGWLNYSSSTNIYAQAYWPMHYSTARTASGLGSTYWSSTNRGNVNSNGFTMITLTVAGTTSSSGVMSRTVAGGYWNGVSLGSTYDVNGAQNGDPNLTTTTPRGVSFLGLPYGSSQGNGTFNESAGIFPGNGTGTIMSEFSIWDKVLTQSEVTALYNNGDGGSISKTTKPTNLIAYWNFDSDSTGTENNKPFAYPVWPNPAGNSNLGKAYLDGNSVFRSGGTDVIS